MMKGCDTLLMVGSSFPYSEFLPEEGQARGVQIDIDARMIGIRYPMEVHLVGDAQRDAARAAAAARAQGRPPLARGDRGRGRATGGSVMERRALEDADPINPQRVFWELSPRLPDGCILSCRLGLGRELVRARPEAARGHAGVALRERSRRWGRACRTRSRRSSRYPDRPAIALVGDGAMQMNGINELITVAKYWQRWSDPRLVVLVLNNRDLNQVTWEQRAHGGRPAVPGRRSRSRTSRTPRYAELVGLRGIRVDEPDQRRRGVGRGARGRPARSCSRRSSTRRCRRCRRTSRFEQAKNFAKALVKGDPERVGDDRDSRSAAAARLDRSRAAERRAAVGSRASPLERLDVSAYTIPTDAPESDGTLEWDSTTIVVVEVAAGGDDGHRLDVRDRPASPR